MHPQGYKRLLLKIQPYDLSIKYIPGKEVPIADALSRLNPSEKGEMKGLDVKIHEMVPQFTAVNIQVIKEETAKDNILQLVMQQLIQGFPERYKKLPTEIRGYWSLRESLGIEDGCLIMDGRLVIPNTLRASLMRVLHQGHPGISKMRLRAKNAIYWPGINKEIEAKVKTCRACQVVSRSQQKEPAIPIEVPSRPWQKLGMDLFLDNGQWYLIIADYYSKFPVFKSLKHLTSKDVITALSSIFSEYGIPEEIISDQGRQFTAKEYQDFAAKRVPADDQFPILPKRTWIHRETDPVHQAATNKV